MLNYQIPRVYSNEPSNPNNEFLLLNNEFGNDTTLFGFELLASSNGTINIQVFYLLYIIIFIDFNIFLIFSFKIVSFIDCGSKITCAKFFSDSHYRSLSTIISSWNFSIAYGFNKLMIETPLRVKKGNMIYLRQNIDSGKVALDQSGNSVFCDIAWKGYLERLSPDVNFRFYLKPLSNFSTYQSAISLYHSYNQAGIYSVSFTFLSSNQKFENTINITDCNIFNI